ncbi:hypothetical protein D3C76_25740 [compost metagenome]
MATPAQLSAKLSALLVAIKNTINKKLDATARAADSSKLEGLTLAQVGAKVLNEDLGHVNGRKGEVAFFSQDGTPGALIGAEMLTTLRMAGDQAALDALKSSTVSFADIFNKWTRISHGANLVFPNLPAELTGWSYDSGTDSVLTTINSVSLIGMISNDRFDNYEFETVMSSTNGDDDAIGMCLAFKKVGNREHSLCVMVSTGGMGDDGIVNGQTPRIMVVVNFPQGVANGRQILFKQDLGIPAAGWGAAVPTGVRVKAKRTVGNMLEITCTRADGSAWPNPVFWSGQIPLMFQTKCAIGYVAMSQPDATFKNLIIPTAKADIIDTRDLTVWRWVSNAWVNAGKANDPAVLPPGRLYKNSEGTKGSYYLDFEGNFVTLGLPQL